MITADMIPNEVVEAASREYELYIYDAVSEDGIRLAIAAALNAWPKSMWDHARSNGSAIILPLPQTEEQTNDD